MAVLTRDLAAHPFLQDVSAEIVREIGQCAEDVVFSSGQTIFREGEAASRCYLLWDGKVSIEVFRLAPGPTVMQVLRGGDVLGWSWLVPPFKWRFDARAVETAHAVTLDTERLRQLFDARPEIGYTLVMRVVSVMEQRLHATRQQLLEGRGVA